MFISQTCKESLDTLSVEVLKELRRISKSGPTGDTQWQDIANNFAKSIDTCSLARSDSGERGQCKKLQPLLNFPDDDSEMMVGLSATERTVFNKQYRLLLEGLSAYYNTIAVAAKGEDIEKQQAELKNVIAAAGSLGGKVGAALGVAQPVILLAQKGLTLLAEIKGAVNEAQRYALIEESLQSITAGDLKIIEQAVGLSVTFMQVQTARMRQMGRFSLARRIFNCTDPDNLPLSAQRLETLRLEVQAIRSLGDRAFTTAIAGLGKAHLQLTEDVKARKGSFIASLQRIIVITEAASEVHEALKKVQQQVEVK